MKCNVLSCAFNDNKCLKDDEAILSEGGNGLYCNCYEEKLSVKVSRFKLIEANIKGSTEIIVMSTSSESIFYLIEEILSEAEKQYNKIPNKLLFDHTCNIGTADIARYLEVEIENNKIIKITKIIDSELRKELKTITCRELMANHSFIDSSILTSTQSKMIKKGVVI